MGCKKIISLVVFLSVLGLIIGAVSCYFLRAYAPKYTAITLIKVLPPIEKDPMTIGWGPVNRDVQYVHRLSMAHLIRQQSTLQILLERPKVQETMWSDLPDLAFDINMSL